MEDCRVSVSLLGFNFIGLFDFYWQPKMLNVVFCMHVASMKGHDGSYIFLSCCRSVLMQFGVMLVLRDFDTIVLFSHRCID